MKKGPKQSRFPISLYVALFGIFLLMSGIHYGLLILMQEIQANDFVKTIVPICYWGIVAAGVTSYTRYRVKQAYDVPMQKFAEATAKVAKGDFSVYVAPLHTPDKFDYLDVMIADFNKMVEELGSIETLKTDFFANVSHEFKTPLAVIQNYSTLMQSAHITEEERREYANAIMSSVKRLTNLITNMLKLSKLEKQTIVPNKENYDICRQLAECAIAFEDLWEKKNIDFDVDIEDEAIIGADEGLMELVWSNLLSNALKFTEANGKIKLSQKSDGLKVVVSVSDTGCGMSEQVKKHIFDKFYQGDTSHSTEGNGLGLALARTIVEMSDGYIEVASELGRGSVFTVTLPRSQIKK